MVHCGAENQYNYEDCCEQEEQKDVTKDLQRYIKNFQHDTVIA